MKHNEEEKERPVVKSKPSISRNAIARQSVRDQKKEKGVEVKKIKSEIIEKNKSENRSAYSPLLTRSSIESGSESEYSKGDHKS